MNRRMTGACAKHQRHIAQQVKYARFMALIPYIYNPLLVGVPSAFLNLQNLVRPSIFHKDVLRETAVVIIKQLSERASKQNHRLAAVSMPVYRHYGTRLKGVQHPLRAIIRRSAQIKRLPQPRIAPRLLR